VIHLSTKKGKRGDLEEVRVFIGGTPEREAEIVAERRTRVKG